ncbi:hypothetical protein CPB85DRAFT_1274314, partial [Mucidula mucida]
RREEEEEQAPPPPPPPPPSSSATGRSLFIVALLPKEYGYAYLEAFDPTPFPVADQSNSKRAYHQGLSKMHKAAFHEAVRLGLRLEDVITIKGNAVLRDRTPDGKVDFTRTVKNYERATGDKVHPMDIRPPPVLVKTLDYLFGPTYRFISDRGRSIRNDLTIQHVHDATAISIHMRIARFHILALHVFQGHEPYTYSVPPFEVKSEQLANTLLSESPLEMEFWADDQRENVPDAVRQDKAAQPSREMLVVSDTAMAVFGELGVRVMMYLLACLIDDIEAIRGGMSDFEIIEAIEPEEGRDGAGAGRAGAGASAGSTNTHSQSCNPCLILSNPFTLPPTPQPKPSSSIFSSPQPQPSSSIFPSRPTLNPLAMPFTSGGIFSTPLTPPPALPSPAPISPPPALPRRAPISLPPTPTVREAPSRVPTPPSTPGPASLFGPALTNNSKFSPSLQASSSSPTTPQLASLRTTALAAGGGELSPLVISRGDSHLKGFESPIKTVFDNGKGKAPERPYSWPVIAPQPLTTSTPDSLDEEETPWQEAVRNGDAYHEKVRPRSRVKRVRTRKPQPGYRTDEELARRFEENHTLHVKRWARGTFLSQLKPMPWDGGHCIWIEDKFTPEHHKNKFLPFQQDAATSGVVVVETPNKNDDRAPGLVIFECTPLGGVEDELERGYAALDDLTRLRAVLAMLKAGQSTYRYLPAVIVVLWETGAVENEVKRMLDKEVALSSKTTNNDNPLISSYTFLRPSPEADPDIQFAAALKEITLDWVAARGRFMDAKAVWRVFSRDVDALVTEYLAYCAGGDGGVNYSLYATLVSAVVDLVRGISTHLGVLLAKQDEEDLPPLFTANVQDDEAMYDAALAWCDEAGGGERELEQFPTRPFLDHIMHIPLRPPPYPKQFIFHHVMAERQALFEVQVDKARTRLVRARTVRRRRRTSSVGTSASTPPKRRRVEENGGGGWDDSASVSLSPPLNGHALSTREGSLDTQTENGEESGRVTVAMLRALTRDVRRVIV